MFRRMRPLLRVAVSMPGRLNQLAALHEQGA